MAVEGSIGRSSDNSPIVSEYDASMALLDLMESSTFSELEARRIGNLDDLFLASHRSFVPIRERFLQTRGRPPRPGPLADIVGRRSEHALDLYLLLHAAAASPPHQLHINVDFWAALVRRPRQSIRNARLAVHRSLEVLEGLELIRPMTRLGAPLVQLLDDGGWGEPYVHPVHTRERYFTLPHEYWEQGLDRELNLPAKAVLLIARSLRPQGFTLPLAHAMDWYGISSDTFRRGIRGLVDARLANYTAELVGSAKAPRGTAVRRTYKLVGAVSHS
jgi:hypothetical protein